MLWRLALLAVLGMVVGGFVNLAIYRLAWFPRAISPWSKPDPTAVPRRWYDRLPVVGWLFLRRESDLHGSLFWVRPLLVELALGTAFAALFWWEVERQALEPIHPIVALPPAPLGALLWRFAAHALLLCLMTVASCIDLDEKTIPDWITVPGAVVGLIFITFVPTALLPVLSLAAPVVQPMWLTAPRAFPPWMAGGAHLGVLAVAALAYCVWCVGLLPRPWRTRRGIGFALRLLTARMGRAPNRGLVLGLAVVGVTGIAGAWLVGGLAWQGLITSLAGLFAGGFAIWIVRVLGTALLKREAMGFGDVTLLAMIGTLLGWQACLMIFFLAPFFGLLFGIAQVVLRRDAVIPYGPFLCLAAGLVVVAWRPLWEHTEAVFGLGWILAAVLASCIAVLGVLLVLVRAVREALFPEPG